MSSFLPRPRPLHIIASTRRPPRPRSTRPSPPLVLRAAATTQRAGRGNERTADPRRSRIERHAAHAVGVESGGRASSAGGGGLGGAAGMLTMGRLQAPARHKPGIEQHQRRALWPPLRETASYLQNRAASKPLCGRFGASQSFDWDRHRLAPAATTRFRQSMIPGLTTGCAAARPSNNSLQGVYMALYG